MDQSKRQATLQRPWASLAASSTFEVLKEGLEELGFTTSKSTN